MSFYFNSDAQAPEESLAYTHAEARNAHLFARDLPGFGGAYNQTIKARQLLFERVRLHRSLTAGESLRVTCSEPDCTRPDHAELVT